MAKHGGPLRLTARKRQHRRELRVVVRRTRLPRWPVCDDFGDLNQAREFGRGGLDRAHQLSRAVDVASAQQPEFSLAEREQQRHTHRGVTRGSAHHRIAAERFERAQRVAQAVVTTPTHHRLRGGELRTTIGWWRRWRRREGRRRCVRAAHGQRGDHRQREGASAPRVQECTGPERHGCLTRTHVLVQNDCMPLFECTRADPAASISVPHARGPHSVVPLVFGYRTRETAVGLRRQRGKLIGPVGVATSGCVWDVRRSARPRGVLGQLEQGSGIGDQGSGIRDRGSGIRDRREVGRICRAS